MNLTDGQVNDLARPLVGIITKFYADPKNEEDYQKWLRNVEERKQRESTDIGMNCEPSATASRGINDEY